MENSQEDSVENLKENLVEKLKNMTMEEKRKFYLKLFLESLNRPEDENTDLVEAKPKSNRTQESMEFLKAHGVKEIKDKGTITLMQLSPEHAEYLKKNLDKRKSEKK